MCVQFPLFRLLGMDLPTHLAQTTAAVCISALVSSQCMAKSPNVDLVLCKLDCVFQTP